MTDEKIERADVVRAGYRRGFCFGEGVDVPEIGKRLGRFDSAEIGSSVVTRENCAEIMEIYAGQNEGHDRQFSPFEFTAKELNDLEETADFDVWEAFDEGIHDGICEGVAPRVPLRFEVEAMAGVSGTSLVRFPNGLPATFSATPEAMREAFGEGAIDAQSTSAKTWQEWRFVDSKRRPWTLYDYDDAPRPRDGDEYGWHIGTTQDARADVGEFIDFLNEETSTETGCDKCEMISIQGINCHETGCPESTK